MKINPLIENFFKENPPPYTLGFSAGKDSVSCALLLQELGYKYTPYFFYHCPDLEFVNRNLEMYERLLKIEIIKLPHPMLYDYLRHQDFMSPSMIDYLSSVEIPHLSFEDLIYTAQGNDENHYFDITGVRSAESFNRRKVFEKYGPIDYKKKKAAIIFDWKNDDVLSYIKSKNIPLTEDYNIWRRSFDGLKYQYLFGVRDNYPKDYDKIKELFPLINLELFRYEKNITYFE